MMKREINEILAHLRAVLRSPKLQPEHCEAMRQSMKELKQIRQSGNLDRYKAFRVSARLAETLLALSANDVETEKSTSKAD